MSVDVDITVEDVAVQLLTYTSIKLESATSPGGSYSVVATISLVADTFNYSYTDSVGTLTTWYRYRYYNATGPVASDYSNPWQVEGTTRKRIRQRMLVKYRCGLVFNTSAGGSTTVITTTDARLKTATHAVGRGKNTWITCSVGDASGESHLISTANPSAGTITCDAFSTQIDSGDELEWIWFGDPYVINEAINAGLRRYFYLERTPIIGVADQSDYLLSDLIWLRQKQQITGLWYFPTEGDPEAPWTGTGHWWDARQDRDALTLMIRPPITADDVIYIEAFRHLDELFTDTSVLPSLADIELCAALAYDELLKTMSQPGQAGSTEDRKGWQIARKQLEPELIRLLRLNAPHPRHFPKSTLTPPRVPAPYRAR